MSRKTLTWPDALARFELHLRARNRAKLTIENYRRDLGRLRDHVSVRPDRVTVDHLRGFLVLLMSGTPDRKRVSAATAGRYVAAQASFFRFLAAEGLIGQDPTTRLERPKLPRRDPGVVLTVDEVARLLDAADGPTPKALRDRAMVEVLYATGLRRAELLALDLGDYVTRERLLVVRHGKGDKARRLPLTRAAALRLDAYLAEGRPSLAATPTPALFLARFGDRISAHVPRVLLIRLAAEAGIDKPVTPHTLRRTFATHLLENRVSLRHIQLLLGHSCLAATSTYLCLSAEDLRRELLLHHPRERIDP